MKGGQLCLSLLLLIVALTLTGFKGQAPAPPDPDLQAAIKERLAMDGRLNSSSIDVKVEDANVTLSGSVETLEEKLLADNLVASTYGVRSLNNTIIVRPAFTKDETIQKAVEETFKTVPALEGSKIQVDVSNGVVTLKGTVTTRRENLAAQKAAESVKGAVRVVNLIKVLDNARSDREIEKDLVFYLQSSSLIDLDQVDYSVEHGVINLKGVIDNLSHKYAVANDLEKIHGVTAVNVKNLIVKNARKS